MTDDYVATNRATWDARVEAHVVAYGAHEFADDTSAITGVVTRDLSLMAAYLPGGSVAGLSLLHLQCHIGTDTLSWARLGAEVTGLDFSGEAVRAAQALAERAGVTAQFVQSPVESAPAALGRQFDVVYTSIGVITWLPDLDAWAAAVFASLAPGGIFHVRDGHPMLYTIDYKRDDDDLVITLPYFPTDTPQRSDDGLTYMVDYPGTQVTTFEWQHPLSEVIQALLSAGLVLLSFQEQADIPWPALPQMVPGDLGYTLPKGRERVPLTFSITARRPL
ncbi:class I SAM-dependent methyltransferase [soil metagenome]